ncbi:hypothetical protein DFH06DRAFT_344885 [Mycena polygramma]|nr:hypothetical protein DFH06DRAFT_344885 [Mycena polygramma]
MAVFCERCGHRNLSSSPLLSMPVIESISNCSPARMRADLDEVASEIARHRAYLKALEGKQRELETELAQIVYPVLTLPPEIVTQIFVACLPSHGRVRPSPHTPPLTLAQICRHWREIALSSSELWSSVDILLSPQFMHAAWFGLRPLPDPPIYEALPMIELWFSRAKERPLSLTVRSTRGELPKPLLTLISAMAGRLYRLELKLSHKDFEFLGKNPAAFPRLEKLAICSEADLHPDTYNTFRDTPCLSKLKIAHDYALVSDLPPLLTSLEIRQMSLRHLPEVLNQCPRLLHITVDMEFSWSTQVITVPHLQSLVFHGSSLDCLNLPDLRRLDVDTEHQSAFPTLPLVLARSGCLLEHLGLVFKPSELTEFREFLHSVPSIVSLRVNVEDVHDALFSLAEVLTAEPALLPRLHKLTISTLYRQFDYLAFVYLIRTRRELHSELLASLGSVRLEFLDAEHHYRDDWLSRTASVEFHRLIDQGLDLRIIFGDKRWPDTDPCELFP